MPHCPRIYLPITANEQGPGAHPHDVLRQVNATMSHYSTQTLQLKQCMNLTPIHHRLRYILNSQGLNNATGNAAIAELSVELKIRPPKDHVSRRMTLHLPIKLPKSQDANQRGQNNNQAPGGENRHQEPNYNATTFSYLNMTRALNKLSELYSHGQSLVNPNQYKHGVTPDYSGDDRSHLQYIYHSEQLLAAWLSTQEAAHTLLRHILSKLRETHSDLAPQSLIKFYRIGLHFHSDKTPCGPCEYVLTGLCNSLNNPELSGFIEKLHYAIRSYQYAYHAGWANHMFRLHLPENKGIALITTYSADFVDKDHRRTPELENHDHHDIALYSRSWANYKSLYLGYLRGRAPRENILRKHRPEVVQYSMLLSGSVETRHNQGKRAAIKQNANKLDQDMEDNMDAFRQMTLR